jgi:hypothetical protein
MRIACSLLLALCSCNRVLGLDETRAVDAAFFDTPTDAAFACPPLGTVPVFTEMFHQSITQECRNFTIASSGRALATCNGPGGSIIMESTPDGTMVPAVGFTAQQTQPRISGAGDLAIATASSSGSSIVTIFERTPTGWEPRDEILGVTSFTGITKPTRDGHVIFVTPLALREYADDGTGTFREVLTHTADDLAVNGFVFSANVTSDGLRVLFYGVAKGDSMKALLYADRARTTDTFGHATRMQNIDYVPEAFMTDDCGRLYFPAASSIFYVQP